jgi:N4-gp56 family major capsid protein
MAQSKINDQQAVKKWAGALFGSAVAKSFYGSKLMASTKLVGKAGSMANAPIGVITDLEQGAGDLVSFDMFVQLKGRGTYGDDVLEGNEEDLTSFTDEIKINQVRHGVTPGGKMNQKRTINDLRAIAKVKLERWHASHFDDVVMTTLGGGRGHAKDLYIGMGATAPIRGASEYTQYDEDSIVYGGSATSKASLTASDTMTLDLIDELVLNAKRGGKADGEFRMEPLEESAEEYYMLTLSPEQIHDLRKDTGTGGWLDIQKAAAASNGYQNHIFKGSAGEYNKVHIKEVNSVVTYNDFGAGNNIKAHTGVFMGRQAAVVAFGSASDKNLRANWEEKEKDYGNQVGISAGMVYGTKLPAFDGKVVNSMAAYTAVSKSRT